MLLTTCAVAVADGVVVPIPTGPAVYAAPIEVAWPSTTIWRFPRPFRSWENM